MPCMARSQPSDSLNGEIRVPPFRCEPKMNASVNNNVLELSEANFQQEVIVARRPVVVQFWAGWSDLCKSMSPVIDSVAREQSGAIKVARLNIEQNATLADQYGVRAVPTVLFFNQGSLQDQIVGRASADQIREKLERFK